MHTVQKVSGDKKIFPNPPDYYQLVCVTGPVGVAVAKFSDARTAAAAANYLNGGKDDGECTFEGPGDHFGILEALAHAIESGEIFSPGPLRK